MRSVGSVHTATGCEAADPERLADLGLRLTTLQAYCFSFFVFVLVLFFSLNF